MSRGSRHLLVKDLKIFLRDVSQWSQLLLHAHVRYGDQIARLSMQSGINALNDMGR